MRKLLVIGVGMGDPDQLTLQAIAALHQVDVFFALDKGEEKQDLVRMRAEICARHLKGRAYRFVTAADPVRDPAVASYAARVKDWHDERAEIYEALLLRELDEHGCGGILVWGDPSLYDSTLRILELVRARGNAAFEVRVVPGISSVQALAASHRLVLNQVGGSVLITTGRRLAEGLPAEVTDAVVLLDAACTFNQLRDDFEVYWGAYLGSKDELLRAGRARDVGQDIARVRAEARRKHGWIMDIYLLRRRA